MLKTKALIVQMIIVIYEIPQNKAIMSALLIIMEDKAFHKYQNYVQIMSYQIKYWRSDTFISTPVGTVS